MDDKTNPPQQDDPPVQTPTDTPKPQPQPQTEPQTPPEPSDTNPTPTPQEPTSPQDETGNQNLNKPNGPDKKVLLIAIGAVVSVLMLTAVGWFGYSKFTNRNQDSQDSQELSAFNASPTVEAAKDQVSTPEADLSSSSSATPAAKPQSQTDDDCQAELKTYKNSAFSICYPASWISDQSGTAGTTVIFRNPQTDKEGSTNYTANLNVLLKPSESDLDTYIADAKDYMPKKFKDYSVTKDEKIDLNGKAAHILEATYTSNSVKIRVSETVLVDNSKVYLITAAALDSAWNNYNSLFDSSAKTFKII